jgi:phage gp29-like protein
VAAPLKRIAFPSARDLAASASRYAQATPSILAGVMSNAERGEVRDWADFSDRMLSIDGHIRADFETRLAAVAGASWELEPGYSGDPERDRWAPEGAEFVDRCLRDMGRSEHPLVSLYDMSGFQSAIISLLDGIRIGFGACEIDWQYHGRDLVPASLWWVHQRRFKWMKPRWELVLTDVGGDGSNGSMTQLPRDRFIVHVPRPVAGYPTTMSGFRAVAWNYLFKRWGMQFWVTGAERYAWPTTVGTVPKGTKKEVREAFLEDIENIAVDHAIVHDAENAIKIVETTVKDGGTWQTMHGALNRENSMAILGMSDAGEPTKVGAFAAVESRRGMTVNPRIAIDDAQISETFKNQLFVPMMKFNRHRTGGVVAPAPTLRLAIASKRQEIPQSAIDAGAVRVNEIRAACGLPKIAGEEGERFVLPKGATPAAAPSSPAKASRRRPARAA